MSYPAMFPNKPADKLNQGDIFLEFDADELIKSRHSVAFMVLTYSCDLEHPEDLPFITYCPIYEMDFLIKILLKRYRKVFPDRIKKNIVKEVVKTIGDISKNEIRFYYFLAPTPEFNNKPAYADLAQVSNLPKSFIDIIKRFRTRSLLSPYREKLGWKIGYLFNRVATDDTNEEIVEQYVYEHQIIVTFLKNNPFTL